MENITVYIRLKPVREKNDNNFSSDSKSITNQKTNESLSFDSIINQNTSNKEIFEKLIKNKISNLLKGINVTIFAYGQTNSGKSFTMKGDQKTNEGIISLSLKELFSILTKKDSSINKFILKISFIEIYNEIVNDLLDSTKKNLEVRESMNKGAFINGATEMTVLNIEKAIQLLNKGITNDSKTNEKSGKNNTIFKINLEVYLKDKNTNKDKKYISQFNLVDLAGSENISKKNENIKECGNMIKSISAINYIVNKLNQNNKNVVNFRDSKITRLLQNSIAGNCRTTFICTIIDDNNHYSETLNTLHFAQKAKNIKNNYKINEVIGDKGKIAIENQLLRNKIKTLQQLINNKKLSKEKNKNFSKQEMTPLQENKNNDDLNNTEQITNLEKEVSMLKQYLMNNEEICSDINSLQGGDLLSVVSGGNNIHNINTSAYKPPYYNSMNNLSNLRNSGSAIKSTYFNSPYIPHNYQYEPNTMNRNSYMDIQHRANLCMTEMRSNNYMNNSFFHSALRKTEPHNNNFLGGSNMKISVPDLGGNNVDFGNDYLLKENEELKRNIYELKKTYYEVIQNKEQQIKLLNQNHDMTLENCEKLIKEAETNYINLKTNYDQALEQMKIKDTELNNLKEQTLNQDSSINYYKNELNKVKDINYATEIETKYNALLEENIKLKQKDEEVTSKLKEENELLKNNMNVMDTKYKEKCQELSENQKIINANKKLHEKELQKYKIEIKNMKALNNKIGKKNPKDKTQNNPELLEKLKEYEEKINKLIEENKNYKDSVEYVEKNQIAEYQKLLDDSFAKIAELNKELMASKDKNNYLEKALNIVEQSTNKNFYSNEKFCAEENELKNNTININEENSDRKNKIKENNKKQQSTAKHVNDFSSNCRNKNVENSNGNNNMLNKKRKSAVPKAYQNAMNKQNISTESRQSENKENNNILSNEFSNFEL